MACFDRTRGSQTPGKELIETAQRLGCGRSLAVVGLLTAAALILGIWLHPLAVDDAFITYRYALNLATGKGFTYNTDQPVLSTTAPLYALFLAAGAWLWADGERLPALANAVSAIAIWIGGVLLFVLGCREKTPWLGALAGLLLVIHPLLWLNLGLETALFLAWALGAILAYRSNRLSWAAILLALATATRGDGLIVTGLVAVAFLARVVRTRSQLSELSEDPGLGIKALMAVGVYVVVLLPLLAWLTWQFGSPLPVTLKAKAAQARLGVTGFYSHTTYLEGLQILVRARLAQSPLYLLFAPAFIVGLLAMRRRGGWIWLIVAWGVAHLVGYTLLGVAPYAWYYAPLIPAFVCITALGVVESVCWAHNRRNLALLVLVGLSTAGLLAAMVSSDWAMVQALDGPGMAPEHVVSKVLPEAKVGVYERAGRWLQGHSPADAMVGVTEVGIIGYYAQRPMVDFLGLLEPEVARAVARGDLYWALLYYQPEYLVLTAVSPLYAYDLRADPWFQSAYTPVQTFDDPHFWGSPVTVYKRSVPRTLLAEPVSQGLPAGAIRLDARFGDRIHLVGAVLGESAVQPGDILALTLYWEALQPVERDYTVFVHLLGEHDRVIAQRDASPGLGARPTSQWVPGQEVADPYLLALPIGAFAPDRAVWEVGLYEPQTGRRLHTESGSDNVRFGAVSVVPASAPMHLDFGVITLTGYQLNRVALFPGETLSLTLDWQGTGPAMVTVQLVDEKGNVAVQASGGPERQTCRLMLDAEALPGVYDLELLVSDPLTGQPRPLLGADGQPWTERVWLTKVRLYSP